MIGFITIVRWKDGAIVGIQDKKRGIILPGGKWEKGVLFFEKARQQLFEQTGLVGKNFRLVFSGASDEALYTYAFTAVVDDFSTAKAGLIAPSWEDLKAGDMGGFYEMLETVAKASVTPRRSSGGHT